MRSALETAALVLTGALLGVGLAYLVQSGRASAQTVDAGILLIGVPLVVALIAIGVRAIRGAHDDTND